MRSTSFGVRRLLLTPDGLWNIDYIFTDGGDASRFETIDDDYGVSFISDHFPIEAVVSFPG